jgi:sirohydrochlorin cobaltochelatase
VNGFERRGASPWEAWTGRSGGLLVVGHGTRNSQGVQQLLTLSQQIAEIASPCPVEGCFLELAQPSIEEGVQRLASRGVRRLVTLPILLFEAGHAKSDIPQAVTQAAREAGVLVEGQSPPLGCSAEVLALSHQRLFESIEREEGRCDRDKLRDLLSGPTSCLVMLGRGASDRKAVGAMRRLAVLRQRRCGIPHLKVGFFAAAKPSVTELLGTLPASKYQRLFLQPHLLFPGELMEQLRGKRQELQGNCPQQRYYLAEPLGIQLENSLQETQPSNLVNGLHGFSVTSLAETFCGLAAGTLRKRLHPWKPWRW